MKILIIYYSKGGNTKQLAQAVLEGVDAIQGAEGVLKKTSDVTQEDFLEARGVIAGSPVYFGTMAAQLKAAHPHLPRPDRIMRQAGSRRRSLEPGQ